MQEPPSRKVLRAPSWDYAQPASYMVTISVQNQLPLFGTVHDDTMVLSEAGQVIDSFWQQIPSRFTTTELDVYVIMPNHLHGIFHLHHNRHDSDPYSLGDVMKWFKGASTRRYSLGVAESAWPRFQGRLWHRNYYESIIHSDAMLDRLRTYIEANPANWHQDPENLPR